MWVWLTPVDHEGCRWRLEVWPGGRVRVFRMTNRWVSNAPLGDVRDIEALGAWLVERGIDPDQLTAA
ncbi:hypothetical protein [Micromonospora inyonensis]|uniref:hypothetical protein n=1 Tax=Micromonospora inyonensis TaxID=47866 RepID=UPI000B843F1C|nr:hypothetical protein [Micromonospora inyonensis]